MRYKFHLSYLLGDMIIREDGSWHKAGYFRIKRLIKKAKKECKNATIKCFSNAVNDLLYLAHIKDICEIDEVAEVIHLNQDYKPILQVILHNFTYFLDNFIEIKEWLKSSEFYSRYKKDNHSYPSLINPKTADYKNISAKLAWEMNLPLPANYKFIWLYPHGAGAAGIASYFWERVKISYIATYTIYRGAVGYYEHIYNCLNGCFADEGIIEFSDSKELTNESVYNRKKFFELLSFKDRALLYQVRDPLEIVRHLLARTRRWNKSVMIKTNIVGLGDDFNEIFIDYKNQDICKNIVIKNYYRVFLMQGFKELFVIPKDKIEFLDTKEINKPSIDAKMRKIMQKFGCNVPQENCNDVLMYNSFKSSTYLWLPLELQVKLNNQEIKILFLAYKDTERRDFVSLANEISEDGKLNNYDVCINKDDLETLKQDSTKYKEVIKYLKDFVAKIKEMLEYQEKQYIVVEDILEHLKKNEKDARFLKSILDEELVYIKQHRPDIVESWKYYQEFLKICKEKGIE